jgi:hypothetical protein
VSDHAPRAGERTGRGFSTRAIAAASRDAGITPGLLRVSVGLEDLEDLQADVSAALEAARRVAPAPAVV